MTLEYPSIHFHCVVCGCGKRVCAKCVSVLCVLCLALCVLPVWCVVGVGVCSLKGKTVRENDPVCTLKTSPCAPSKHARG